MSSVWLKQGGARIGGVARVGGGSSVVVEGGCQHGRAVGGTSSEALLSCRNRAAYHQVRPPSMLHRVYSSGTTQH